MSNELMVAVLLFVGTLIGTVSGVFATSKLSNCRLEQLEKKVDRHNNLIERVYLNEQYKEVSQVSQNKFITADRPTAASEKT